METLLLQLINDSIQRDHRRFATNYRLVNEYGLKRCPNHRNALLARIGDALAHTGSWMQHRSDCGCPEQESQPNVAQW
ncbi:MAG: hypothetical protein ACRDHN_02195 [Thermomicrobiales bacterium]